MKTQPSELHRPVTARSRRNDGWIATFILALVHHTAALLTNGLILVVGGARNGVSWLSSSEVYNPTTEVWTATGNLKTARASHTATLLSNGKVLVAGGYNFNAGLYLSSAELYDPTTGFWSATGPMTTNRIGHTATLLATGKVLVAGGYGNYHLSSAELYDPDTGTWTGTGSLTTNQENHSATLLADGRTLAAGGTGQGTPLNPNVRFLSAEVYDPASNVWTAIQSMNVARANHSMTRLPNGKPQVQTGDVSFGVRTNQFGFNIDWAKGMKVVIEASTNPTAPTWLPLQTNTLTADSLFFTDPDWTSHPARFYRVRWP